MLPKLNTPTYTLVLPSTNEEVKYRPFLVKEQKLLLMAQESDDQKDMLRTTSEIVNACTFGKVDAKVSPIFDIEFVFLKLRAKSVGETAQINVLCPDDNETYVDTSVNLDEIEVQISDDHSSEVVLTDTVKMVMKYPKLDDIKGFSAADSGVKNIFNIMKTCIYEVHDGLQVYNRVDMTDKDIDDFIEQMDTKQFEKITQFFETMPRLRHMISVTNPKTNVTSEVLLEGLESFFS